MEQVKFTKEIVQMPKAAFNNTFRVIFMFQEHQKGTQCIPGEKGCENEAGQSGKEA